MGRNQDKKLGIVVNDYKTNGRNSDINRMSAVDISARQRAKVLRRIER
jgi:hypothetical protein